MLHLRRSTIGLGLVGVGSPLLSMRDWMTAADPGLLRLLLATRGTLSVFLTTVTAMIVAHFGGWSVAEFASGITLSLMGPFLAREPTLRQRRRTLITLMIPAAAATIGTTLLHGYGPAGDSCFLALVFVCFLLHSRGARWIGIGLVAVIITYVGLYLELPPATLPLQLASILLAVPITALVCFVILPIDHGATLRRTVAAAQGRAAQVLHSLRALDNQSGTPGAALARLRRDIARLNEAALAADDLLALLRPEGRDGVRAGLIDLELATARLIDKLREDKPGPRHAIRLRLHERRMRRGRPYSMAIEGHEADSLRGALVSLGHAVHAIGIAAKAMVPADSSTQPVGPPLPPGPLAWRMAFRVTLASALAMAGGMALSPQRWFWAVITVYVVFLNARSRGDTILKGVQRLSGTLLGMAIGLVIATLLHGQTGLQSAALLLSVFGMYYYFLVSYTAGIFCVTVMLGLLYGMIGMSLEQLLVLRFEETAVGAVSAILVATFVLPIRTREQVIRSGRAVLDSLVGAVRASRLALSGAIEEAPMAAMRRVDRQVADLRLALAPLTAGRTLLRRTTLERQVPALLDCVHWTRVLAAATQDSRSATKDERLAGQARQIEWRLAKLASTTKDEPATPSAPPTILDEISPDGPGREIAAALDHLTSAVRMLAERMEIGQLESFSIDA